MLVERHGDLVTREDIQKSLWPSDTIVEFDHSINTAVTKLRQALGDSAENPRYVETVARRGYRLIVSVDRDYPAARSNIAAESSVSSIAESSFANSSSSAVEGPSTGARAQIIPRTWRPVSVMLTMLGIAMVLLVFRWYSRSRVLNFQYARIVKLTDTGKVDLAAISPDGRYVCYSLRDRGGLGLELHQMATGSDIQILPADAISFEGITFSPDGNYIYYVRADKNDPGFKYLYVMPVLGGLSRLLVKDIDSPVSFSPNGSKFVYTRGMPAQNATEVRIANADGTGNRLLATVPNINAGYQPGATWSPDGRTIAVSSQRSGKQSYTLYAVSVSDGSLHELHSSSNTIGRPLWLPEGNTLLVVLAGQNGRGQLWTISYPKAEIRRVTNDLTDYGTRVDLTRDAKTIVAVANQTVGNIWVAPAGHLDEAKQITSIASLLFQINESPDGRLLAAGQDGRLWSLAPDGSQRIPFTDVQDASLPTPCGRYVVFIASRTNTTDLVRVDSDGANPATLVSGDLLSWSLVCSRDGKYAFYVDLHRPHTILRIPVAGGNPVKIGDVAGELMVGSLSISPDQRYLAYPYEEYSPAPVLKLAIIPANGGLPARILNAPGGAYFGDSLMWSLDGKCLQYILSEKGASNIWEQPLDGGKPRQLTNFSSGQIFDFHWSVDGKRLLLSRGEVSSDVVLLSDLR